MDHDDALVQVELALANAKRARREAGVTVQTLARLRDDLQGREAHKEDDTSEHRAAAADRA